MEEKVKIPIINTRPTVTLVFSLIVGILLFGFVQFDDLITFFVFIGLVVTFGVLAIRRKSKTVIIFLLLGYLLSFLNYNAFVPSESRSLENVSIQARIFATYNNDGQVQRYIIEDIIVEGKEYKDRALITLPKTDDSSVLAVGDRVALIGNLVTVKYNLFSSYSMSRFKNKVLYNIDTVKINFLSKDKLTFSENIKLKVNKIYLKYMSKDAAQIAMSLIFGEKYGMPYTQKDSFSAVGLSHVFAVSGLHIGFICSMVVFLTTKTKRAAITSSILIILAVLTYAVIVGFSNSILRAAIMLIISYLAKHMFLRYDPLSALAASAFVILIVNPLSLFDVGFLLSFVAMLGIISFYSILKKSLESKSKALNKYIITPLCLSVSANAYVLPISAYTFQKVSVIFVITNIILMPLITLSFVCVLSLTAVSLIIPSLGILMYPFGILFDGISILSLHLSGGAITSLGTGVSFVFCILITQAIFFLSKFVLWERRKKLTVAIALFVLGIILCFVAT